MMSTTIPNEALPEISISKFRDRYPELFTDPSVDDIYCGPGWHGLLVSLCDTLIKHIRQHSGVSPLHIFQIKSKFGELRFYYDGGDAYCEGAVDLAVQLSLKTCSACGSPGRLVGTKWLSTLCTMHDGSN
jgi:hypothetical protein